MAAVAALMVMVAGSAVAVGATQVQTPTKICVEKIVVGPGPAGATYDFTITRVKEDPAANGAESTPAPQAYKVTVKAGESACVEVKHGTYAVAEVSPPAGGVVLVPAGNVKVDEHKTMTVEATNTYPDPKPEPKPEPDPEPAPPVVVVNPPAVIVPPAVVVVQPHFTG